MEAIVFNLDFPSTDVNAQELIFMEKNAKQVWDVALFTKKIVFDSP